MARQRRRRIKFSPFRMGKKFERTVIAGLGVFLMMIFAMPFAGPCRRQGGSGPDRSAPWVTLDGETITIGEAIDFNHRWGTLFGQKFDEHDLGVKFAQLREARRAGIRVSDEEVLDFLRDGYFARRVRIEYAVARSGELDDAVPDGVPKAQRADHAAKLARQALLDVKAKVDAIVGKDLQGALKRITADTKVTFGESQAFSHRTARIALRGIGETPSLVDRAFGQPIGQLTEVIETEGGYCILRVVSRSRGFGPDGAYYEHEEGWAGHGFGDRNVKSYMKTLNEMQLTQSDLEQTIREQLTVQTLAQMTGFFLGGYDANAYPRTQPAEAMVRDRLRRDSTQAAIAYFGILTDDFANAVPRTADDLRAFYNEHKGAKPAAGVPGYLEPPRVAVEYVLGRKAELADSLSEATLRSYYGRHSRDFTGAFDDVIDKVRDAAADNELKKQIGVISAQADSEAAEGRAPDLRALASQAARTTGGAFVYDRTELFSAGDADVKVRALRGGSLAKDLFGDNAAQYAVAGEQAKEGQHAVSSDFACEEGRYFFRVLERVGSREVPYEEISAATRQRLMSDYAEAQGFKLAHAKAVEYRSKILADAFEKLAAMVGVKPVDTDFLLAETPIPPLGKTVPKLYRALEDAEVGDLSDVALVGDQFMVARLAGREEGKGIKLQVLAFPAGAKAAYEPSEYELRAAYDHDPYSYLDPPRPIPFDDVKADIRKLLERRRAEDGATERIDAASGELIAAEKPDLAAAAKKHKLTFHAGVKVDLTKAEATAHIGKAAGFHDAVKALEPGKVSGVLASADGRALFALNARGEKTATIDVALVRHADATADVKVDDKDVRQYYDDRRDTAYVTDDEIKKAPAWADLDAAASDRVKKKLTEAWDKKTPPQRFAQIRLALIQEAFRTVPSRTPLTTTKSVSLGVRRVTPFSLSKPRDVFLTKPELLGAVKALKAGEVSKPLATDSDALLAYVAGRTRGGEAKVSAAFFDAPDYLQVAEEPAADAIQKHYEAHKQAFELPERAVIDLLVADKRSRAAAEAALAALRKAAPDADLKALAAQHKVKAATSKPFALIDPVVLEVAGRVKTLAEYLRDLKPGDVLDRVVDCDGGYLVCRLRQREAARIPALDEGDTRGRVVRALKLRSARDAARKAAEAFRQAAAKTSFEKALSAIRDRKPDALRDVSLTAPSVKFSTRGSLPELAAAVYALEKPGLTDVVEEPAVACVASVTARTPEELFEIDLVTLRGWSLSVRGVEAGDDELKAYYEKHRDTYRVPDKLQIEYIAATYDELAQGIKVTEAELNQEYERSTKARESLYKDWTQPAGLVFLPFERARDLVRKQVVNQKTKAKALKLLTDGLSALRKQGAAADFAAYAAAVAGLGADVSPSFDAERKTIEPIGPAPEAVEKAFAAKDGDFVGPLFGPDGGIVFRRKEFTPAHVPSFEDTRYRVEADLRRERDRDRALKAAGELRAKVVAAVAAADAKRDAFRTAVEAEPVTVELPLPVRVTVTRPFHPVGAGRSRPSYIPGLGQKPELTRAVFRLRRGEVTPVIDDGRSAAYVATVVRRIEPGELTSWDLSETRRTLGVVSGIYFTNDWERHFAAQVTPWR